MRWNGHTPPVRKIPVRVLEDDKIPPPMEQSIDVNDSNQQSPPADERAVAPPPGEPDWESMALRLQAEMENFRKRQARRVDESAAAERDRLLRLVLPVADNLARALSYQGAGDETLRHGVELTYRELMRLLESEGVRSIETVGHPFNPELHEAVATVEAGPLAAGTVVEELERGYRMGGRLLRPARVVVAA